MTLASLFGMKPAVETVRDLLDSAPFPKQKLPNATVLSMTKMVELVFEASPETLIQSVALLGTPLADQSTLQYASLVSSIAAVGALTTLADREADTNAGQRESEPAIIGYVSREPVANTAQLVGSTIGISCYTAARMLSLGVLITTALERWSWSSVAFVLPLSWAAAECGVLAVARVRAGNWRFWRRYLDEGVVLHLMLHLVVYVAMTTTPFPLLKMPVSLGGSYFSTLACVVASNVAMVAVAYGVFGGVEALPAPWAWAMLGGLALTAMAGGAVVVVAAPAKMRKTFFEGSNWKEHVASWWWDGALSRKLKIDGNQVEVYGHEAVRATLPVWCARHTLPIEKLKDLYAARWAAWEADPPHWFTPAFQELIYDDLVPKFVLDARIAQREIEKAESSEMRSSVFGSQLALPRDKSRTAERPPGEDTKGKASPRRHGEITAATSARTTPPAFDDSGQAPGEAPGSQSRFPAEQGALVAKAEEGAGEEGEGESSGSSIATTKPLRAWASAEPGPQHRPPD